MKKTLLIFALFLFAFAVFKTPTARAQTGSMMGNENTITQTEGDVHAESVETVLQDILNQQNVSTVQELDLSKISDDNWERLGDAVMEVQHPGQAHAVMDQMMGGEGSESLGQIHINMGKVYLGYGDNYGPGMMGGGMTPLRQGYEGQVDNWNNNSSLKGGGFPMMGFGSMMGYGGTGIHTAFAGVTWIALVVFLVAGAYFFIKQAGKK